MTCWSTIDILNLILVGKITRYKLIALSKKTVLTHLFVNSL